MLQVIVNKQNFLFVNPVISNLTYLVTLELLIYRSLALACDLLTAYVPTLADYPGVSLIWH